jgi:hypothetical protein
MLLSPAILALFMVSAVITLMLVLAGVFAIEVLRHWDLRSGSEYQLKLERKTYLISTLLTMAFAAELISLLLFVYNAESMSGQFVGAMCATGVLNVNAWGWPTLFLKISVFFIGSVWLALNYLDNKGYDYPLIRWKYGMLLFILPLVVAEFLIQSKYFFEMDPDVITSCCGSLFSSDAKGVAAEVSSLSPKIALYLLYGSGLLVMLTGTLTLFIRKVGPIFSSCALIAFIAALISIVSYVSLYIYEHPHHHCPFCILKSGHDYAGYMLYVPLFSAVALALSAGSTSLWSHIASLKPTVDIDTRKLTYVSLSLFVVFYAMTTYYVLQSQLTMGTVWW